MKVEVVFLTVSLMVVYVVSERQDDTFTMCNNVDQFVQRLYRLNQRELYRTYKLLSNSIRPYLTGTDSKCLNVAFKNYLNLVGEDTEELFEKCPRAAKDYTMECIHASVKRIDCILKSAKKIEKITAQILDYYSSCSNYMGDSKIAKIISAKRSELVYDKTIIYLMEEAQRKYKGENTW